MGEASDPYVGGEPGTAKRQVPLGVHQDYRCTGGRWPEIGGRDQALGSQEPTGGWGGGKRTVLPLRSGVTVREVGVAPPPAGVWEGDHSLCVAMVQTATGFLGSTARPR